MSLNSNISRERGQQRWIYFNLMMGSIRGQKLEAKNPVTHWGHLSLDITQYMYIVQYTELFYEDIYNTFSVHN